MFRKSLNGVYACHYLILPHITSILWLCIYTGQDGSSDSRLEHFELIVWHLRLRSTSQNQNLYVAILTRLIPFFTRE